MNPQQSLSDSATARLREVPWRALVGLAPALDEPLASVLSGQAAERTLDRFLRAHPALGRDGRAAVAEAIFGVGLWRRRLAWHAGTDTSPRLLLAALLRDLGGIPAAEVELLLDLPAGALPASRPPPDALERRASLPDWLAATLRDEAGPEADALADALNQPGPVCLRPNLLRTTPGALAERLAAEGVATRRGALLPSALVVTSSRPNVLGLAAHQEGLFEVQDEGSQLLGRLVGACAGDTVLDLCAGAGGKALQLAADVGPSGTIHAADPDLERLERLRRRAERAGASAIVQIHGAAPPQGLLVDRALVDAPCSELGALRRGPDLRFRIDTSAFAELPPLQLELLVRAVRHLRPGGRLVYATCTLRRQENEEVALAFERDHPELERVVPDLPAAPLEESGFVRTWPHRQGCDGFFAALWQKRRSP